MNYYGTPFCETELLLAGMNEHSEEIQERVSQMTKRERSAMLSAMRRIENAIDDAAESEATNA